MLLCFFFFFFHILHYHFPKMNSVTGSPKKITPKKKKQRKNLLQLEGGKKAGIRLTEIRQKPTN